VTSVIVCESCLDFNARIIFHNLFVLLNFPFASPDLGEPIFGLSCVRCLPLDRLLVYLLACLPVHKPTGVGKILVCFSISADLFLLLKSPAIFLVHASATIGLRSSCFDFLQRTHAGSGIHRFMHLGVAAFGFSFCSRCHSPALVLQPKDFSPSSKEYRSDIFSASSFSSRWNRGPMSRPLTQFGLRVKDFVFCFHRRTPIFCLRAHRSQPRYRAHTHVHHHA
jgi:hypothetical protein